MLGSIVKVHKYSEKAKKILRNLHRRFVLCGASQIYGGDFAKFCNLLRIYELYQAQVKNSGRTKSIIANKGESNWMVVQAFRKES